MLKVFCRNAFNEILVRIEAAQHKRTSCLLHKIAGKQRRLVQQQTNKRQLSMKYQQQYISSRRKASKTIANCLYLDLLLILFRAGKQRKPEQGYAFRNGFSENFDEKYVFFSFEKWLLLS